MALESLQEQQRALALDYANSLPERLRKISEAIEQLQGSENSVQRLGEVHRLLHTLSGSAASFGFAKLGEAARRLDLKIRAIIESGRPPAPKTIDGLRAQVSQLTPLTAKKHQTKSPGVYQGQSIQTRQIQKTHLVYLIEDDTSLAQEIASRLTHFGYQVRTFLCAEDATEALEVEQPAAMVVDVGLPEGMLAGPKMVKAIEQPNRKCPVIFISVRGDWEARLAAVRAGGSAYLLKPVDFPLLVSHLDSLLERQQQEPYRILIVDDDIKLAQHYAFVLNAAGIHAEMLNHPKNIFDAVVECRPELILMDLYMPEVNGSEVAKVVRQHQDLFSIPVVFLSSEPRRDMQLDALQQGDDFLQKPISNDDLVRVVSIRAERSRALGKLMYHDGLTGLLNHSSLKQQLETELARGQRQNLPVSFVLIDLDFFKSINDRFGHSTGDRVLKSLSRLFQERLRQVDIIGRYGGEEFGVILPDTSAVTAKNIIESLRLLFAAITHRCHEEEFNCTFSAGIAAADKGMDAKHLIDAADAALYEAKQNGRNRIKIYTDVP